MKLNNIIKKVTASILSAAILLNGGPILSKTKLFSDNTTLTVSAWSAYDSNYKGSSIKVTNGNNVSLKPGQFIANGNYRAVFQSDGNFVVYQENIWIGNTSHTKAIWSSCTAFQGAYRNYRLTVQTDGNLVIYATPNNWSSGAKDRWIWASGTNTPTKGNYELRLGTNGELALYLNNTKHWSNKTDNRVRWHIDLKSQWNDKWKNVIMGGASYKETIGSVGCALCSTTMIYNLYQGTNKTPTYLNTPTYLDSNNCLRWGNVGAKDERNNTTYNDLATKLKQGPVVVGIDNSHFVVVSRCTKSSGTLTEEDFIVFDPGQDTGEIKLSTSMDKYRHNLTQIVSWTAKAGRNMPKP